MIVREGDLPAGTDTGALARFYVTVLFGLSVQAGDGATPEELDSAIGCAMAAWPS